MVRSMRARQNNSGQCYSLISKGEKRGIYLALALLVIAFIACVYANLWMASPLSWLFMLLGLLGLLFCPVAALDQLTQEICLFEDGISVKTAIRPSSKALGWNDIRSVYVQNRNGARQQGCTIKKILIRGDLPSRSPIERALCSGRKTITIRIPGDIPDALDVLERLRERVPAAFDSTRLAGES